MNFDIQGISTVPGDLGNEFCISRENESLNATGTGGSGNTRNIDITSHRGTGHDETVFGVRVAMR